MLSDRPYGSGGVRRICLLCGGGYTYRRFGEMRLESEMDADPGDAARDECLRPRARARGFAN
jgi:hypothetical protein